MTYEELKKAYELALQKCSELEKKIEEKDLRIEHLTELVLKRNKMLFGQKSEKAKFINDGQLAFEVYSMKLKPNQITLLLNLLPILLSKNKEKQDSIEEEKRLELTLKQKR